MLEILNSQQLDFLSIAGFVVSAIAMLGFFWNAFMTKGFQPMLTAFNRLGRLERTVSEMQTTLARNIAGSSSSPSDGAAEAANTERANAASSENVEKLDHLGNTQSGPSREPDERDGRSAETLSEMLISESVARRTQYWESIGGTRGRMTPTGAARVLLMESLGRAANSAPSVEDAAQIYQRLSDLQDRIDERTALRVTTEQQLASTSSLKSRMISLFVAFNFGVILALIFSPTAITAGKELILGLYISLATFIVYVYRASNARALVLLAIKEDLKRYHDAEKYLSNLRPKAAPSERDIDILKLLMINRSEREKHSEHPYELALKGITNSTILLKGGKVANVSPRKKDKESDN
jgi:hypothetical protein